MPYIVVDAGHGGADNGAQYFGYKEKDINLRVATKITHRLREIGFRVTQYRTDDSYIADAPERGKQIAWLNPDFAISIHSNSSGGSGLLSGSEIITPLGKNIARFEYYARENLSLLTNFRMIYSRFYDSEKIQERFIDPKTLFYTESIEDKDYYGIIREAWNGGVPLDIIELFYLDNEDDLLNFLNLEDDYVEAIVYSLAQTFNLKYDRNYSTSFFTSNSTSTKLYYRIVSHSNSKSFLEPIF